MADRKSFVLELKHIFSHLWQYDGRYTRWCRVCGIHQSRDWRTDKWR